MKRKIFIFVEKNDDHRSSRLSEEAQKKNIDLEIIEFTKLHLRDDAIVYNGEKLIINSDDVVWFSSNSRRNHYLARLLSRQGNKMWPSYEALDFANKYITNYFFSENNVPTPKTALLLGNSIDEAIEYVGGFPCIIKKNISSQGKHVEVVNSKEDIHQFVENTVRKGLENVKRGIVPLASYSFEIQEYIKESAGSDYRVLYLGGKILGCIKREAESGFKANISLGGSAKSIDIDDEMRSLTQKIAKAGNIFFAGIDFIKSERGYLAIEINTSAQFQGFEKATGMNVAGMIIDALYNLK